LQNGTLSAGHARTLVGHPDAEKLAAQIVKNRLSVRDAEKLAKTSKNPKKSHNSAETVTKDADTVQIENDLSAHLGLKVNIAHVTGRENGQVVLNYRDLEQLDDLLRLLSGN
jgi:ParB family chromosome partitioning protein